MAQKKIEYKPVNIKNKKAHQKTDAGSASFDIAGQAAGASIELKIKVQAVQVAKHPQADLAHGTLGDAAKYSVAQFTKQHIGKAREAVGKYQGQRYYQ